MSQPTESLLPDSQEDESMDKGKEAAEISNSEDYPNTELRENGFTKLNTHDVSFVDEHIPNIGKFAEDLQTAIGAAWPTRRESRYRDVQVLLLSWEDDNLGVTREIERLGLVFSNLYSYNVHEFKIPRKSPGRLTTNWVSSFLETEDVETLFIVYYAGHAGPGKQFSDPPIWAATDRPNSPSLPSYGIQQLLEESGSDVLLLYDCCHSSHPAINISGQGGVTEVIAACGFETRAPIVGPHSFTNTLITELEDAFVRPPISVSELHGLVLGSLKNWKPDFLRNANGSVWTGPDGQPRRECHKRRTPIHCFLTNETPYRSIILSPLRTKLSSASVAALEPASSSKSVGEPSPEISESSTQPQGSKSSPPSTIPESPRQGSSLQVLIAVRLDEDFCDQDNEGDHERIRTWCDWLKNIPEGVKNVSVQGIYESCSTLVLISVPVIIWNLLPANAAYSFVGFVKSANLLLSNLEAELKTKSEVIAASEARALEALKARFNESFTEIHQPKKSRTAHLEGLKIEPRNIEEKLTVITPTGSEQDGQQEYRLSAKAQDVQSSLIIKPGENSSEQDLHKMERARLRRIKSKIPPKYSDRQPQGDYLKGESYFKTSRNSFTHPRPSVSTSSPNNIVKKAAFPKVVNHTTDKLDPEGDEYIPCAYDKAGEKKITATGCLLDGRNYRCRTFYMANRKGKLFMLATECATVLGFRDSYLLFENNKSLYKIVITPLDKEDLILQGVLPASYRSRQIAVVTAKSMFRQYGSQIIEDGRLVKDDYWDDAARNMGFAEEEDSAGNRQPGASKAQEATVYEVSEETSPTFGAYAVFDAYGLPNRPNNPSVKSKETDQLMSPRSIANDWI